MPSVLSPRPPSKSSPPARVVRPAHGTARLTLTINGQSYTIRPIPSDAFGAVGRAFRLRKSDGTTYDVAETVHGPTCDCGDFTFRRDGIDPAGCKHIRALSVFTLLAGFGK